MPLYSVKFEILSPLTGIPNSQTIFGTICSFFAMYYGNSELEKVLSEMERENFPFIVSSMFYENMLPVPQNFEIKKTTSIDKNDMQRMKKIKKIEYFSKNVFKKFKDNPQKFNAVIYDLIKNNEMIIINNCLVDKAEVSEFSYPVLVETKTRVNVDNELYYNDKLIYLPKGTNLEFYIKIESKIIFEKIRMMFEKMKYVSLGGNKSIGYNMFNFKSIRQEDDLMIKEPNMLISLALGDETIDYDNSYYQLLCINNKFTNSRDTVNRKNIIAFKEGSIIKTSKKVIGKIVKESINDETTYQNFVGLLI